jgi:hypothetical protein
MRSHPLSEFMSFGYPHPRSGYRNPQNLTTDDPDDKDLLSAPIRVIRGQAPPSPIRDPQSPH